MLVRLVPADPVERRLRHVDVALLDQRPHEPEQQGQQQRVDVVAVDVGVGHQHDLVVAQLVEVELLVDAGAERGDDRLDLGVGQHLVDAGLLDVEDLAADREDRLDARVPALPGRAAGRVALDDEDLALLGVGRLAVRQLAGQAAAAEQPLAGAGQVPGLPGRDPGRTPRPGTCGRCRLPSAGFCSSQAPSWSLTTRCTKPLASVLPSLVLVWPSNCGSPSLIEMIAVRPSRMSSPETRSSRFLIRPHSSPQLLTSEVSAARKPSSWVPPSWVLMVLAKVCTDSVKDVFHCIATSRLMWLSERVRASRPRRR